MPAATAAKPLPTKMPLVGAAALELEEAGVAEADEVVAADMAVAELLAIVLVAMLDMAELILVPGISTPQLSLMLEVQFIWPAWLLGFALMQSE